VKFGISTYNWVSPFSTKTVDLIPKVKAMGFDVFEMTCEEPEIIDLEVVKREIEENDIDATVCTVMGPGRDLNTDDPETVRSTIRYLHWCIKAAEFLGSPIISGPLYSYVGKTRLLPEAERLAERKRAVNNLKEVAVIAADHNVKLALEPLNRFEIDMINTVDQGLALIDEIDHPSVGFLLDSFHMHIEEKDSAQAIRKAGQKLFHFHSCENDRCVPGSGQVDWTGIRQALQDINYSGSLVIESFTRDLEAIARAVSLWRPIAPDQDTIAIDGLAFLRRFFAGSN
jgi:D-psicose/D-tagatose/L-ribulose 3-epimerase